MKQLTRKKKISFMMQSLFEGKHHITYFDSDGNPIRTVKPKQQKISFVLITEDFFL